MKGRINKSLLEGEYLTTYNKAETYLQLYKKLNDEENECLIEINDLLMNAQENGQPITEVIGDNFRKFITNIYNAYYPFSFTEYIYFRHIMAMFVSLVLTLINIYIPIFKSNQGTFTYLNTYCIIMVVQVIQDLVKSGTKGMANKSNRLFQFLINKKMKYVFTLLWLILFFIFSNVKFINTDVSTVIFITGYIVSLIPGIVYYALNSKDETIKNDSKSFKQMFVKSMDKKYTKINKKLEKKNKLPYSDASLAKHIRRIYKIYDLFNPIILLGYVILFVFTIQMQIKYSFSIGGVFSSIIILLVMILLTSYYHSRNTIFEYISELEKRNLDLFEEGVITFNKNKKEVRY